MSHRVFVHAVWYAPAGRGLVGLVFFAFSISWFALFACFVLILACISVDAVLFVVPVVFVDVVLFVVEKNHTTHLF